MSQGWAGRPRWEGPSRRLEQEAGSLCHPAAPRGEGAVQLAQAGWPFSLGAELRGQDLGKTTASLPPLQALS